MAVLIVFIIKWALGFLKAYINKCLLIELCKANLDAESQKPITVYYENEIVGEFVADIIVNDTIILELKSLRRIIKAHEVQLVNYLVATGKPVGLILNSGERKVEIKRKVKDLNYEINRMKKNYHVCPVYPVQ